MAEADWIESLAGDSKSVTFWSKFGYIPINMTLNYVGQQANFRIWRKKRNICFALDNTSNKYIDMHFTYLSDRPRAYVIHVIAVLNAQGSFYTYM